MVAGSCSSITAFAFLVLLIVFSFRDLSAHSNLFFVVVVVITGHLEVILWGGRLSVKIRKGTSTSAFSSSAFSICLARSASSVAVTTLGAIWILKDPPASQILSSIALHASFKIWRPSVFSGVDVVMTYRGGAIKLIRIGTASVEQAIPALKPINQTDVVKYRYIYYLRASLTASIPS